MSADFQNSKQIPLWATSEIYEYLACCYIKKANGQKKGKISISTFSTNIYVQLALQLSPYTISLAFFLLYILSTVYCEDASRPRSFLPIPPFPTLLYTYSPYSSFEIHPNFSTLPPPAPGTPTQSLADDRSRTTNHRDFLSLRVIQPTYQRPVVQPHSSPHRLQHLRRVSRGRLVRVRKVRVWEGTVRKRVGHGVCELGTGLHLAV